MASSAQTPHTDAKRRQVSAIFGHALAVGRGYVASAECPAMGSDKVQGGALAGFRGPVPV
jgi:hypothetical protein